jgi:hypothetical protein
MDITSDPHFSDAVEQALGAITADIRAEMDKLVTIADANVTTAVKQSSAFNNLDWLFFRRWRLADGWLVPKEAGKALQIFHDPLAIAMRCAVTKRLYPNLTFLARRAPS